MPHQKYAILFNPAFKPGDYKDQAANMSTLFKAVRVQADSLKAAQTQHRILIQGTLESALKAPDATDDSKSEAIRKYEADYESGTWNDFETLTKKMKSLIVEFGTTEDGIKIRGDADLVTPTGSVPKMGQDYEIRIRVSGSDTKKGWASMAASSTKAVLAEAIAAVIYLDDKRFILLQTQPAEAVNQVWKNRGTGKHYVKDCYGRFVRRYQTRCLNEGDRRRLTDRNKRRVRDSPYLLAKEGSYKVSQKELENYPERGYKANDDVKFTDALFFHLQQGSKRFVSMSSTKHGIYGNTGTSFYTRDYGLVSIDLAYVPKDDIVDVHDPRSAMLLLNASEKTYQEAMSGNQTQDGTKKAIRDVVRTREVLVFDKIPLDAIHDFGAAQDADYPVDAAAPWNAM